MSSPERNPFTPPYKGSPKESEADLVEELLGSELKQAFIKEGLDGLKPSEGDMGDDFDDLAKVVKKVKKEFQDQLRPDEVLLKNIPSWKELPDPQTLKKEFKLDWILQEEYRKGRSMADFGSQDLAKTPPFAKVFEIGSVIRKKQKEDPGHVGYLTTEEVLEAIDKAGYRPATLEEILAYAREHWKPGIDPKSLMEEERAQNAQASSVIGLNSVFSDVNRQRAVPHLYRSSEGRRLSTCFLSLGWSPGFYFLVLRKASS